MLEWLGLSPGDLQLLPLYIILIMIIFGLMLLLRTVIRTNKESNDRRDELQARQLALEENRDDSHRDSFINLQNSIAAQQVNIDNVWEHTVSMFTYQDLSTKEIKSLLAGVEENLEGVANMIKDEHEVTHNFHKTTEQGYIDLRAVIVDIRNSLLSMTIKVDEIYDSICVDNEVCDDLPQKDS